MKKNDDLLDDLTQAEAEKRLNQNGANEVSIAQFDFKKAIISRLWEPSAWILEAALILELVLGKTIQAIFILMMLLFSAIDGAIQSRRANKVLQSLTHQLIPMVATKRSGTWTKIPAKSLVVGDLIDLRRGDIVPADVLVLTAMIETDDSTISGESRSVKHQVDQVALAGTQVLNGHTLARVVKVGKDSRYGKTVSLINDSSAPGQLQKLLGKVIGYLAILDAILAVILIMTAVIRHDNLIEMLPFLAMLFIATIPIAMPSSFAVANSFEASVLSNKKILVSDLSGIQTAANMNLLLIDKTGTITTNQPQVVKFYNFSRQSDHELISWVTSAIDVKNPSVIDSAIMNFAQENNIPVLNPVSFEPFVSDKGYSEAKVDGFEIRLGSYKHLSQLDPRSSELTKDVNFEIGRTVAVTVNKQLMGLFIVQDSPRADSLEAIKKLQSRGVKVVMLTGDNQVTASAVAEQVGLNGQVVAFEDIAKSSNMNDLAGIAEVVPENKLAIVKQFQGLGYTVGMTGDGVNDAPALKQADVGIAVANAVDLAKRSAKMVLLADGLMPIIDILDSGHRVYQRMMTWTITKLSRTAELTMLLTIGYLWLKFVPLSLNAMVLVAILNDLVTLVLGTDRTSITYRPENWNLGRLSKVAGVLAVGWTLVGFAMLHWFIRLDLPNTEVSTALYCYLIFSAMLTILMTRTTKTFWTSIPSKPVIIAVGGNCLLTILLSVVGIGIASVKPELILFIFMVVFITGMLLTLVRHFR